MLGSGMRLSAPSSPKDEMLNAVEIVKDKLYFAALRKVDNLQNVSAATNSVCFSIDNELIYEPFFADFGPLNLGLLYRFCTKLDGLLRQQERQPEGRRQRIVFCCANDPYRKANAATLIGSYCTLYFGWSADDAYKPLTALKPFAPFRDASCGTSSFHLTVLDSIRGMEKAKAVGFVDFHLREKTTFNLQEYEYFEQVENGDLNWILPGKFIAFSGPSSKRTEFYGYRTLVPEDYWDFFRKAGVSSVIRLNKKMYERRRFLDGGFRHHELYFPDGSCPSEAILKKFIEITEAEPGVSCVHCKAGLGRTGVLICAYIMKHYGFTANEVIGYIRICRPGSVIGPQQHYLKEIESKCWRWGEMHRAEMNGRAEPRSPNSGLGENEDESGENIDTRRTSPMKPMRTGTRPSVFSGNISVSASVGGAGTNNRYGTPPGLNGNGSYRGVGSGASAVAAARDAGRVPASSSMPSFLRNLASGTSGADGRRGSVPSNLVRRSMAVSSMQSDVAANSANMPGRYSSNPPGRPTSYHTQQPSSPSTATAHLRAPSARSRSVDKRSTADNVYGNASTSLMSMRGRTGSADGRAGAPSTRGLEGGGLSPSVPSTAPTGGGWPSGTANRYVTPSGQPRKAPAKASVLTNQNRPSGIFGAGQSVSKSFGGIVSSPFGRQITAASRRGY